MARIPTVITEEEGGWSEWIWIKSDYRLICCHCGLSHDYQTRTIKGKKYIRIRQNLKSTAAVRRQNEYEKT